VDKFIYTPVKRYSSGMYVWLAFAIAAHLEPEILIVDEVLAVGDLALQQKCLGKMREGSREKDSETATVLAYRVLHSCLGKAVRGSAGQQRRQAQDPLRSFQPTLHISIESALGRA
jgi:hypothetical protein